MLFKFVDEKNIPTLSNFLRNEMKGSERRFRPRFSTFINGTVVAHWTAGQQVARAILRQGHDS